MSKTAMSRQLKSPRVRSRRVVGVVALAGCGVLAVTGAAQAGGPYESKVSIAAEGTDIFGKVKSDAGGLCTSERKVLVFKVKRSGDERVATDTTETTDATSADWSVGNLGLEGRFYAKIRRTDDCLADRSRTIRVQRSG